MARKITKILEETTDSRTYNLAFGDLYGKYWLEEKRNYNYNAWWRSRPHRNWKYYRKTQYRAR